MYRVVITDYFKKQLKKLVKKDPLVKGNFKEVLINFNKDKAIAIGSGVYKIRIAAYGKGKSGGYRSYLLIIAAGDILTPLCIYAKNQKENLTFDELTIHVRRIKAELDGLV